MSFFDFFRRKEPQDPKINEDWKTGDIAECVVSEWICDCHGQPTYGPKFRERYRVTAVSIEIVKVTGQKHWFLNLAGWPTRYDAMGFRKVRPVHDEAKSTDEAFLKTLLGNKAPAREDA